MKFTPYQNSHKARYKHDFPCKMGDYSDQKWTRPSSKGMYHTF